MERSTFSGFLSIISTKVVVVVVSLLTTPVLVRLLTKAQYGDYAFVLSVFGIYMILVSSGVGDGVRKYVAEDRDPADWEVAVIGFYFRAAFVLAALGALGLALVGYFMSGRWFDPRFEIYFYVLAVLVFAAQFRNFNRRVLMGLGLERYSEPLKVLNKVTLMGVGLALVYLGFGVLGMLVGYVVASATAFVVGLYYVHREVSIRSFLARAGADLPKRELVMYNSWNIVLILLLNSLYHVDVMMLKPIAGSVQTSYYKAALTLAEFLWFVPLTLQAVLLHSTSELWSRERHDAITDLSTRVTRYTLLLTSLFAIGLFVLAPVVVPLYLSDKYTAAVLPLRLLLPGALGFAVARPLLAIGQGKGDLSILVGGVGAAAGINLVLNAVLIPRYGPTGAAVATGVGYGSMFLFMIATALRIGHNPLSDLRGWRILTTVGLSFGAIYGLNHLLESDVLSLLVVPLAGFLLFSLFAFLTGALDVEECRAISAKLPEPVGPPLAGFFAWVGRPAGDAAPGEAPGGGVLYPDVGFDEQDGDS